jgi:hypothetical protein
MAADTPGRGDDRRGDSTTSKTDQACSVEPARPAFALRAPSGRRPRSALPQRLGSAVWCREPARRRGQPHLSRCGRAGDARSAPPHSPRAQAIDVVDGHGVRRVARDGSRHQPAEPRRPAEPLSLLALSHSPPPRGYRCSYRPTSASRCLGRPEHEVRRRSRRLAESVLVRLARQRTGHAAPRAADL